MRKILSLLGALFLILILIFLFMHFGMRKYFGEGYYSGHMMSPRYYREDMMGDYFYRGGMYPRFDSKEAEEYIKSKEKALKVYAKYEIDIKKKQLEIEAELLKENPDWDKVEKTNDEIALMESKVKTEIMKINHSAYKK